MQKPLTRRKKVFIIIALFAISLGIDTMQGDSSLPVLSLILCAMILVYDFTSPYIRKGP